MALFKTILLKKSENLVLKAKKKSIKITTAESCTGGLISSLIISISGASEVFENSFVTYSNSSKTKMLGVSAALIKSKGAVSKEVAKEMAIGALKNSAANISVSVTGIAGPGGGTKEKPVGLVYIAAAKTGKTVIKQYKFKGDREKIRLQAVEKAVDLLSEII